MGLLVDRALVDAAASVPALRDLPRSALVEALFTRDERVLPPQIAVILGRTATVTLKPKADDEVQNLVQAANGLVSLASVGLPPEDHKRILGELRGSKDRSIPVRVRPGTPTTHPWIVPPQGGIELDLSGFTSIEVDKEGNRAFAAIGARWKALYDEATRARRLVPFFPLVPLDYTIGDILCGDAVFGSYRAPFRRYLYAVRSITPYGRKARIGFEEVTNHGTGYDLTGLLQNSFSEFAVPVGAALVLAPRPRVLSNLVYRFPDAKTLAEALGKLVSSGRPLYYANIYDAGGWGLTHPVAGGPFSLEIGVGGAPTVVSSREKALDALLAGFTAKAADIPAPHDADAQAFARNAERIARLLIPGYLVAPVKAMPELLSRIQGIGGGASVKVSFLGAVRQRGVVLIAPGFDIPKEPSRIFDSGRRIWEAAQGLPGVSCVSRLAHLWSEDEMYGKRLAILRELKGRADPARVVEPMAPIG